MLLFRFVATLVEVGDTRWAREIAGSADGRLTVCEPSLVFDLISLYACESPQSARLAENLQHPASN